MRAHLGVLDDAVTSKRQRAEAAAAGLFRRDPSTWSEDLDVQKKIANRLGWLSSPQLMAESIPRLQQFADAVRHDRFTDVVLLGMGGSSLAPEVLRAIAGVTPGYPRLHMLDSTDPAAIRSAMSPPDRTLYLLASKSGTTIEPNALAAYFRQSLIDAGVTKWSDRFVAITDEGTELHRRATADGFRDVFVNPSDIGGRYSALSFFGMVPAALMGQDLAALVGHGLAMLAEPGAAVELGLAIGAAAVSGRDKATLMVPPHLEPFGLWVEQLIAESTGKNGVGIVPIAGEPPAGASSVYGPDRFFIRLGPTPSALNQSVVADAPHVDIEFRGPASLGTEFVRWEIATAVAGAILGINPFDEPNVQQAKDATQRLLGAYKTQGRLPSMPPDRTLADGTTLAMSTAARQGLQSQHAGAFLSLLRPGDYFAVLAYLGPDESLARELRSLRERLRDRAHVATMLGYGPRYLHSTGQLHKGGPNTGVFLLITTEPGEDLPIPGEPFSFGTLEHAQALGDFQSLDATGRRAVHAHLPSPEPGRLKALAEQLLGTS
jgi:glucose-6-phosphate isomerase